MTEKKDVDMILTAIILLVITTITAVFLIRYYRMGEKKVWISLSVILGMILLFMAFGVWSIFDYYSPKYRIEVAPYVSPGGEARTEFSLPSGRYVIVAEREADRNNALRSADIHYHLEIPGQQLIVDSDGKVRFPEGVKQVRLKTFVIKENMSKGVFSVRIPNRYDRAIKVKVSTDRSADM